MTSDIFQKKQIILKKLVNSGINISPSVLDFILTTDNPLNNIDLIIKETSFLPTFNSHLTIDTLTKISDEKIQKSLKKIKIQEEKPKIISKEKDHQKLNIKQDKKNKVLQIKEDKSTKELINQKQERLKLWIMIPTK